MERFSIVWNPTDGPIPFVFENKPAGHRCAWSCRWATSAGTVLPGDWFVPERMTNAEIEAELLDLIALGTPGASEFIPHMQSGNPGGKAARYLIRARESYSEFILPSDPPRGTVLRWVPRPGWPFPEE